MTAERIADIDAKMAKLKDQLNELAREKRKLQMRQEMQTHRTRLNEAIGKPGAVIFSHQCGDKVRGRQAVVLKVNRTRAVAKVVGGTTEWSVPFELLIDAKHESDDAFNAELSQMVNGPLQGTH
ncbi:hypothetical protein V7x_24770 [Crateriforma conspicua]|uniref:Uncharacterized protein n=1 Tax=Crateriforma conspicua TaxID=2527996 RepID=A0A5C6FZ58_9PLAN|nr:hypothetical protein [Crateriforma conspicua]TWU66905.1 hypothetical protein V7x_24770 [Crateriforma conspicua]